MNVLKPISTKDVFQTQRSQYTEKLLLSDTVPAGSTKLGKTSVSNLGHFWCQYCPSHQIMRPRI